MQAQLLSRAQLFATPSSVAHQAPLPVGFPRQEYWSGLPFPPSGDLPNPGIELVSPALAGGRFTTEPPGKSLKVLAGKNKQTNKQNTKNHMNRLVYFFKILFYNEA